MSASRRVDTSGARYAALADDFDLVCVAILFFYIKLGIFRLQLYASSVLASNNCFMQVKLPCVMYLFLVYCGCCQRTRMCQVSTQRGVLFYLEHLQGRRVFSCGCGGVNPRSNV